MTQDKNIEDESPTGKSKFLSTWILEMCVLALLLRDETYGYRIAKFDKLQISESSVYPILRRLSENGYLDACPQQNNGKIRKVYRITPKGTEHLAELQNGWRKYVDTVDWLLKGSSFT